MKKFTVTVKKIWYAVADGSGRPTAYVPIIEDVKEGTMVISQDSPSVTPLKNELGQTKASKIEAGQKTVALEIIGLDPNLIQKFAGGKVTSSEGVDEYAASLNPNSLQTLGIMVLSDNNVLYELPFVEFSAVPQVDNTADGQRFIASGNALYPLDGVTSDFYFSNLTNEAAAKNEITDFSFVGMSGTPTIDATEHTVTATATAGTALTAIAPDITVSKGAYVSDPFSGANEDFTATVTYKVEAANGDIQAWDIIITSL